VCRRIAVYVHTNTTDLGRTNIMINAVKDGNVEVGTVLDAIRAIKSKFGDAPGIHGM
jgi:hypothetical protein